MPLTLIAMRLAVALSIAGLAGAAASAEPMEARIAAVIPGLEATIERGMTAFDSPGLAIGIVTGDRVAYAKGFGVRSDGGEPVDADTVFQIGPVQDFLSVICFGRSGPHLNETHANGACSCARCPRSIPPSAMPVWRT